MPRPRTIPLAQICGVRVGASLSWFVVLGLTIVLLWQAFSAWLPRADSSTIYLVAVLAALGFTASIGLHELGHAVAARRCGINVLGVDLWMLGGLTHLERNPETPNEEWRIALAGPLVNAVLLAITLALLVAITPTWNLFDALDGSPDDRPLAVLLSWLALVNGGLMLFNLLPGLPLDGGRLIKALVWHRTGSVGTGNRLAGNVGRALGLLVAIGGFMLFFRGGFYAGLSGMIIGWFLMQSARQAKFFGRISERIDGVTAEDVMQPVEHTLDGQTTATDALEQLANIPSATKALPVVGDDRLLLGLLSVKRIEQALYDGRPLLTTADLVAHDDLPRIELQTPLREILDSERLGDYTEVPVVDALGRLAGVVTVERVRRAMLTGK